MKCKKCNNDGCIVLRGMDSYCESCFLTSTNHKFRACIGKNKILSKNENVLICLSGGPGSSVLLDLVYMGLGMESHKKLRITPIFLHVIGPNETADSAGIVIEQCKRYGFEIYVIHISDYMEAGISEHPDINKSPVINEKKAQEFQSLLKSMRATVLNDQLKKIKRSLFLRVARQVKCKFIFTAETTTTLAMNLLSNLTLGRGAQVENDVGFYDTRNDNTTILRPMREISAEEINHYMKLKHLDCIKHNDIKENSIQSVIKAFVTELQEGFPATISTVCKTADKLGVQDNLKISKQCIVCESDLNTSDSILTALEATNLSRMVSDRLPTESTPTSHDSLQFEEMPSVNESLFPFLAEKLCYGCSRNLSELDQSLLPMDVKSNLMAEDLINY